MYMKSAEIFRRAAMVGSILGASMGAVDLTTNPGVQQLRDQRTAISQQYGVSTTCARDFCATTVEGNYSPEQEAEIIAKCRQDILDLENKPENQAPLKREETDKALFGVGLVTGCFGLAAEVTKKEEKQT